MLWLPFWLRRFLIWLLVPLPIPEKYKGNIGSVEDYFWYYSRRLSKNYNPADHIWSRQRERREAAKLAVTPSSIAQKYSSTYSDADANFIQRATQWLFSLGAAILALANFVGNIETIVKYANMLITFIRGL